MMQQHGHDQLKGVLHEDTFGNVPCSNGEACVRQIFNGFVHTALQDCKVSASCYAPAHCSADMCRPHTHGLLVCTKRPLM